MTSASDPHQRYQRRTLQQVIAGGVVAVLAALWAWRVPAPADTTITALRSTKPVATPVATGTIDPTRWNVTLWRPFADEVPDAGPASPKAFKLFSIMQQGDGLTAAIAAGDDGALLYVKAGDSGPGFSVVRVEATSVVLRINGQDQRLGLGP